MDSHDLRGGTQPVTGAAKARTGGLERTPRDGDLLVARELVSSGRFTIRQLPAAVQISTSSRDQAMQVARRFAQMHAVDVWYQDNDALRLLDAYRVESGPRPIRSREEG